MGQLGNLFYEVKFKDSTNEGIKSIESKIKNLNATIKPKILIKDVGEELRKISEAKSIALRIKVQLDTSSIKGEIDKISSIKGSIASIKADTSTLSSDIQNAINKGTYLAKITADTSGIVDAIKNAVSKPIDVTIKTNTTSNASGGIKSPSKSNKGKGSKTNDLSQEEKELERLQKAYDKIISKSQQAVGNITRFSNIRANGEMSIGLKAARDRLLSLQQEMRKTSNNGVGFDNSKVQELSNAIRVAHEQMRLYRSELQKAGQIQKRIESERPLTYKNVSKVDNSGLIKNLSDIANKYESQIVSIQEKIRSVHSSTSNSSVSDYIRGLNAQIEVLSRKAEAARVTISKLGNMQTVTNVTHLPTRNSTAWKEQQEADKLSRDARRAEITRAFKEQEAYEKAGHELSRERIKEILDSRRELLKAKHTLEQEITKAYNIHFNAQQKQYNKLLPKSSQTIANISRLSNANGGNMSVGLTAARDRILSLQNEIKSSQSNGYVISDKKFQELSNAIRVAHEQMKRFKEEQRKSVSEQKKQEQATKGQAKATGKFEKELEGLRKKMRDVGLSGSWLKDQLQNVFSIYILKDFFMNLVNIGGEFEKQKLALNSILGSMDKANTLYNNIKDLAVKSPFTFGELTSYTKQLASYGFQYKDIFESTKRLADISAGVGVDMSRIILAYGQVFTAHFLRGQELRQFTEAGIPMVDALADRFTKLRGEAVSAGDVFKMISNKEVAFEDVKAVLDEMTNSGGRFYNMQEKLSESLSGKWSNLQDQIEIMYSEIEEANKSTLKGIVSLMTSFVKNWKTLKNIGSGVLVFLSLLGTKKVLFNALTNGITNNLNASMASSYANKKALEEEIVLYNNLIEKIRERNRELINGQAAANNPAILRGTGLKSGGASTTSTERRNLWLQRARMNLLCANEDARKVGFTVSRGRGISWGDRILASIGTSAITAASNHDYINYKKNNFLIKLLNKGIGGLHRSAIRATLGIINLGNSFGNFLRTMFTGVNGWLMAISAIAMIWFDYKQKEQEFENNMKESMEGARQAYEEFSKFVKDNPIDIAINAKDDRAIDSLIEKYKEELENAPLDLKWVVSSGDNIQNRTERLKYYRQALEDAADAEKAFRNGESSEIAHNAMKETEEWYPWSDNASDNLKDMIGGFGNLRKALDDIDPEKLDKALDNIYKKYPKYRNAIDDYRKGLLSLDAIVTVMNEDIMRTHLSDKDFGIFTYFRGAMQEGGIFTKSVRQQINEYKNDMDGLYKFLEDKAKKSPKLGINFNNLDDKGFMKFEKIIKDMATEAQWSQQQLDMVMADLTSRMTPSKDATWFFDTGIYKEALDAMSEYTDEFKGKTQQQIEEGLKEGSKSGMRRALDNAKAVVVAKWPFLAKQIQSVFDRQDFHINVAIRYSTPQSLPNGFQRDFKDFLDKKVWGKDLNNPRRAKYEAIGPKADENITETISRLQQEQKSYAEQIHALTEYNKKNGNKKSAELQDVIDKRNAYNDILRNFYGVEPEKSKEEKSSDKDKDKAKKERERKLHDEEKRLQNEFKQLKKVKDLYEKLRDLYGDVGALNKITNSGLVAAKYIPKNVTSQKDFNKKYTELLNSLSKRISPKSDTLKNLKDEIQSDLFDLKFNVDKNELDKQVSILETELQRAGDAWSRYMSLVNDGLDNRSAGIMAFGLYNNQTDKSQQKNELSSKAGRYIEQKAKRSVSEKEMEEILNMNEAEIKVHFGNDAEITNGLWKIVEAYQNVAKEIRSENDKLVADLYKDSLSYAERIENISKKEKRDIATIKEGASNNRVTTERYNSSLANQESIRVQIDNEQNALDNSEVGRMFRSALEVMNKAKAALSDFDNKFGKKLTPEQKKERQNLVNTYNTTTVSYNKAQTNYQNSTQYKTIEALRPQQEKAIKETANAQRAVAETIPESQANRLIAQVTLKANKDKGAVMDEMFTKRGDYSQLFNNIYSLAVDNANKIAEELIAILDQRLEEGTITAEDYNKKRTEITEQTQKANENKKNNSVLLNGLSGVTKFRYDQANGRKNDAANRMEAAKRNEENVDKNPNYTPAMKIAAKAMYQQDFKKDKEDYKKAEEEGNKQKQKEARQDMTGSVIGQFNNAAESLSKFRDSLNDTMSAFGVDTENNEAFQTFSTAVDVVSDIGSGMQNAFQSFMSGDFFGGAMSIITTPLNVATAFAKLHDKKLEIQINQSKERAKQIKAAADQITSSIENNLGAKSAKDTTLRDYAQLNKQMTAAGRSSHFTYGYDTIYSLLSDSGNVKSYVSKYVNEVTKAINKSNNGIITGKDNVSSYYRNNEVLEALKNQGFDKTKDVSVYGAQYAALLEQRKELELQMSKENKKSGKDKTKVDDYRDQIAEMNKQIREFTENLAKELYGIDFSSWADKLGDALTNAFRNGEDAAQAFEKTVDDIMADVVKNMFIQDAIKPMFDPLREALFGKDGEKGIIDMNDLEGSLPKATEYMSNFFDGIEKNIPGLEDLYEALNKATGGKLSSTTNSSSSMGISSQGLTEETGSLLASYINAIRADVSISRGYLQALLEVNIPQMNAVAESQLRQLYSIVEQSKLIEENTRANTVAAESIRRSLDSVVTMSGSGKAIRIKA